MRPARLVALAATLALALASCTAPRPDATAETSPSLTATGLTVTIDSIRGAKGSRVAVIAYDHPPGSRPEGPHGIGGYAAAVDADPFSISEMLREGSPLYGAPSRSRSSAVVPLGTYMVIVWVSSRLGPYSDWIAAAPVELSCWLNVTVSESTRHVWVWDVPPMTQYGPASCPGRPLLAP